MPRRHGNRHVDDDTAIKDFMGNNPNPNLAQPGTGAVWKRRAPDRPYQHAPGFSVPVGYEGYTHYIPNIGVVGREHFEVNDWKQLPGLVGDMMRYEDMMRKQQDENDRLLGEQLQALNVLQSQQASQAQQAQQTGQQQASQQALQGQIDQLQATVQQLQVANRPAPTPVPGGPVFNGFGVNQAILDQAKAANISQPPKGSQVVGPVSNGLGVNVATLPKGPKGSPNEKKGRKADGKKKDKNDLKGSTPGNNLGKVGGINARKSPSGPALGIKLPSKPAFGGHLFQGLGSGFGRMNAAGGSGAGRPGLPQDMNAPAGRGSKVGGPLPNLNQSMQAKLMAVGGGGLPLGSGTPGNQGRGQQGPPAVNLPSIAARAAKVKASQLKGASGNGRI